MQQQGDCQVVKMAGWAGFTDEDLMQIKQTTSPGGHFSIFALISLKIISFYQYSNYQILLSMCNFVHGNSSLF